jgi:uncharacterized lipoprotein YmbA
MMMHRLLAALWLGLLVASCASTPPSRFYTLDATAATAGPVTPGGGDGPLSLAIGPVDLPRYLDRPQIVSRDGQNRLSIDEFNRWGGALDEEIHRVLGDRLAARLATERIYRYPSRIVAATDYRVAVEFYAFDGIRDGPVRLDAVWSLLDDATAEVREVRRVRYLDRADGADYAAYAAALGRLLARLADDIAVAIGQAKKNPPRGDG